MEEKELVELSKSGDEEAFSLLVKKYSQKVFHLAFSLTQDREMADDLAQETFIKAFYALPKFRHESGFGTWLYRITVNKAKDYFRKKGRMSKMPLENLGERPYVEEDEVRRKEKELDQEQKRRLVHQCLQALPQKHQVVLTLRDIQGLSYEKIADILSISPGTVDSRLHRARKLLRKKLTPFLSKKGGGHEL